MRGGGGGGVLGCRKEMYSAGLALAAGTLEETQTLNVSIISIIL